MTSPVRLGGIAVPPPAGRSVDRATTASARSIWPTTRPRRRHRHRALVARLRRGRLQLLRRARAEVRRHPEPGAGQRQLRADFPLFGGQNIWKAVPVIIEALKNAGRLFATETITHSYPHCWRHKTPGDLPRRGAVVRAHGRGEGVFTRTRRERRCARLALDAIDQTGFFRRTAARLRDMIANRPDWCISRQRSWACRCPSSCTRRPASCTRARWRSSTRPPTSSKPAASRPGAASRPSRSSAPTTRRTTQEQRHPRGLVRFGSTFWHVLRGPCTGRLRPRDEGPEADPTSKATTSTAAGSTARCCWPARSSAARPTAAC